MSVHNKLYVKTELFAPRVDGSDFSTADWAFLGTIDQNMAAADEVEFKAVTLNNGSNTTKLQTGATTNYTLTLPVDDGGAGEVLSTNGSGVLSWASGGNPFDQSLNTTDSPQFVNLTLTGDLTVSGTTTLINTTNTEIKDNIIILNNGEAGAGVGGGTGTAGIEIERGSVTPNVQFVFDETTDKWTLGSTGAIGTTRFIISELADASQTQGAIPGFDANGRLAESEGLTAAEVNQLQNIDSVTITNTQWGYIGALDQGLTTTSNVTFNDLTVNGSLTLTSPIAGSVSAVLVADPNPVAEFINIFDTSGGVIAPTLPDNATNAGKTYVIYLKVAGNDLTVTRAGTDTIEGSTTCVLDVAPQHLSVTSVGDGTWLINV
jgi:hypothetical protein